MRRLLALLVAVAALAALALSGHASASSRQDMTLTMADGTKLAATLWLPDGTPPAGGWPALVLFHPLGSTRETMNTLAQLAFLPGDRYAILAYDARGNGQSSGLTTLDGPNEVSDARAMFEWLRDRPDVSDTKIGAFGISLGGGAVWNSLVAGVPWAAVEVCETWTNLATALVPQGLAKSGAIAGFLGELPPEKVDPSVLAIRDAAFTGNIAAALPFAAARSSIQKLRGVKTPVFMMQGRRDFAFGLDQVLPAWPLLAGPKHLWVGLHGHAPSTFPAPDTVAMMTEGRQWFDHYLLGTANGIERKPRVEVAPATWKGKTSGYRTIPRTISWDDAVGGRATISQSGKVVRPLGRLRAPLEVFGSPTVRLDTVNASGGWSRIVAVLSARTPAGKEVVVGAGGVPAVASRHTYTVRLNSTATYVPRGSRLTLSIGSSSQVQNPANLLYLDLPMPAGARLTVGGARIQAPALAIPVSST